MSESPPAWAPIKGRAQGSGLNAHDPAASPPTVFDGTSAFSRALASRILLNEKLPQTPSVPESTATPGPIVEDNVTRFR